MSLTAKLSSAILVGLFLVIVTGMNFIAPSGPKVVYVNTQEVFQAFNGTKELDQQLGQYKTVLKSKLDSLELVMKNLSNTEMVQIKKQEWLDMNQQYTQETQAKSQTFTDQIWKQINEYSSQFGEEKGYDYILGANGTGTIMHARKSKDITQELVHFINKKYDGN